MKRKIFICSLLTSVGFFVLGAGGLTSCASSSLVEDAKVTLSKHHINLAVGERAALSAKVSKGYNSELRWFSNNETIAYAENGYVFGVGEGTAKIIATYAGGIDTCIVTVGEGGDLPVNTPKLILSAVSKTLAPGASFALTVTSVYPEDTTVTFESGNTSVALISADGMSCTVTGGKTGIAAVTAKGSNGVSKVCTVTVSDSGGDPATNYNTGFDEPLKHKGKLSIGSPKNQRTFMTNLLKDFNILTQSSIEFTIIDFEESNGTSGYNSADAMPAVFPYASDQTMTLSQFKALSNVPNSNVKWIKDNMGDTALEAATLESVVGYPFSADNGLVMFYNKSICSAEDIDTVSELFALAKEKDYEINYNLSDGFLVAPALMTYNGGNSLYEVTPDGDTYTATAKFNSEIGLQGAKLVRDLANRPEIRNAKDSPRSGVLATITDSSSVQLFKSQLGSNYAVAPLPFIDDENPTRLGSFLGYKFYGVNLQLGKTAKAMANDVAKFLCSEYAQYKRYMEYQVRPTLLNNKMHDDFLDAVLSEPHIKALIEQSANHGVIPMKAVASTLWSQTMTTYQELKKLSASASDAQYYAILKTLDAGLKK